MSNGKRIGKYFNYLVFILSAGSDATAVAKLAKMEAYVWVNMSSFIFLASIISRACNNLTLVYVFVRGFKVALL